MANKRDNLLYRLRKKGVQANTRERIIFFRRGWRAVQDKADKTAVPGVSF